MSDLEWKDEIGKCVKCGKCRSVCPVFLETGNEALATRGRISLAEGLAEGLIPYSRQLTEYLYTCLKCLRCASICPSSVQFDMIMSALRAEAFSKPGKFLLPKLVFRIVLQRPWLFRMCIKAASLFQPIMAPRSDGAMRHLPLFFMGQRRIPKLALRPFLSQKSDSRVHNGKIKVAFFTGCLLNYACTDISHSVVRVLNHLGVDVIVPKGQACCGAPAQSLGDKKIAKKLAERNYQVLLRENVDAVVTACASCGRSLKREYRELLGKEYESFSENVYDISEFICKFIDLDIAQCDTNVTYHDPCHLKWGQDISDEPRKLLKAAANFMEMKNADRCCGQGGTFSLFHYDISCEIAEHKVAAVKDCGAEVVTTNCPGCIVQLRDRLAAAGVEREVRHTIQIVERALLKTSEQESEVATPSAAGS